jgi:hypothetical protein
VPDREGETIRDLISSQYARIIARSGFKATDGNSASLTIFCAGMKTLFRALVYGLVVFVMALTFINVGKSFAAEASTMGGSASGTLTVDGKSISLKYAYAMAQPNTFDANKTDIAVLLTEESLAKDELENIERLEDAAQGHHGWAFFKIDEEGKPVHEVIDHPSVSGHLIMTGFTKADFVSKKRDKKNVEGSFKTSQVEKFLEHSYEIKVDFSAPLLQARHPEPLPDAKTGKALPQDGGEPGRVYRAYLKAIKDKDIVALRKMAPAQKPEISDDELREMMEFMAALTPKDPVITRGYTKGDRAVLYLEGALEGEKQFGTVELVMKGNVWSILKEHWSNMPPKE